MRIRLLSFVLMLGLLSTAIVAPLTASAAAPTSSSAVTVPVNGAIPSIGGLFNGTFSLQNFSVQNGQLVANGLLSGTLTDAVGTVIGTVTNVPVALPVAGMNASCQILDLTLGPLHLDLLGLVVDLNQVHLTITAQQGNGNLLGNLLCAVANALNGGSPLTSLANLLNHILAAL